MDDLITDNIPFAYYMANTFKNSAVEIEDLHSVALIGLVKAAKQWDPKRGAKFTTYAGIVIKYEILQLLRKENKRLSHIACSLQDETVEGLTLGDMIPDTKRFEDSSISKISLGEQLYRLSDTDKKVWRMRAREMTQREIGVRLGVSQVGVSRSLKRIRKKVTI